MTESPSFAMFIENKTREPRHSLPNQPLRTHYYDNFYAGIRIRNEFEGKNEPREEIFGRWGQIKSQCINVQSIGLNYLHHVYYINSYIHTHVNNIMCTLLRCQRIRNTKRLQHPAFPDRDLPVSDLCRQDRVLWLSPAALLPLHDPPRSLSTASYLAQHCSR